MKESHFRSSRGFSLVLAGSIILLYVLDLLKTQYILIAVAVYLMLIGLIQLIPFGRGQE